MSACHLEEEQKSPCSSLKLEEEKWKRRVTALDTAIKTYILMRSQPNPRGLLAETNVVLQGGSDHCSNAYSGPNAEVIEQIEATQTEQQAIAAAMANAEASVFTGGINSAFGGFASNFGSSQDPVGIVVAAELQEFESEQSVTWGDVAQQPKITLQMDLPASVCLKEPATAC